MSKKKKIAVFCISGVLLFLVGIFAIDCIRVAINRKKMPEISTWTEEERTYLMLAGNAVSDMHFPSDPCFIMPAEDGGYVVGLIEYIEYDGNHPQFFQRPVFYLFDDDWKLVEEIPYEEPGFADGSDLIANQADAEQYGAIESVFLNFEHGTIGPWHNDPHVFNSLPVSYGCLWLEIDVEYFIDERQTTVKLEQQAFFYYDAADGCMRNLPLYDFANDVHQFPGKERVSSHIGRAQFGTESYLMLGRNTYRSPGDEQTYFAVLCDMQGNVLWSAESELLSRTAAYDAIYDGTYYYVGWNTPLGGQQLYRVDEGGKATEWEVQLPAAYAGSEYKGLGYDRHEAQLYLLIKDTSDANGNMVWLPVSSDGAIGANAQAEPYVNQPGPHLLNESNLRWESYSIEDDNAFRFYASRYLYFWERSVQKNYSGIVIEIYT